MTARRRRWEREVEEEEKARKTGKPSPRLQRAIRSGEKAVAKLKKAQEEAAARCDALNAGYVKPSANAEPKLEPDVDPDPKP